MKSNKSTSLADARERAWAAELAHRRMAVARWRGGDQVRGAADPARSSPRPHQRRDAGERSQRPDAGE